MARILQFLECPQYLRKYLFPLHPDLQYSGVISPLDLPHHLRKHEVLPYREGVVSNRPLKEGKGSYIYVGLEKDVRVDRSLPEKTRVTVKLDDPDLVLSGKGKLRGKLVSPTLPRREAGIYWGYSVRIAKSLSEVFSECPFPEGYDLTIGTSEKGSPVSELKIPDFKGLLIVFGGVEGLEFAFDNDEGTTGQDVSNLFHNYVNTCPSQGSRTIRTEEAILISLAALAPLINIAKH
jgi:predicted SPOUT superfamily RNA methylase MTH1